MAKKTEESQVAEAVGTAGSSGNPGISASEIEEAMAQAVIDASEECITDPDEIRERKLAARQAVKDKYAAAAAGPDSDK